MLVISDRPWLAARSGGDLRTRSLVRALSGLCEVDALTVTGTFGEATDIPGVRLHESGDPAARRVADAYASLDWLRRPGGHPTDALLSPETLAAIEAILPARNGVVVLESLGMQAFIAPLVAAGHRVVLYTHGVQALLADELSDRQPGALGRIAAERTREIEERAFNAASQVWVCSALDGERVRAQYGPAPKVHIVPNAVELPNLPAAPLRPRGVRAVYPATLAYPPNRHAALRLVRSILPLVRREVPHATVTLVGPDPSPEILAHADEPGVTVTGEVPDVQPYLGEASALVVPLDSGTGTRLKILEAFAARLPVISSATGIEGIDAVADRHHLAAESDAEFAAAMIRLADDPALAATLTGAAYALVRERYSTEALPGYLRPALAELVSQGTETAR